MTIVFLPHTADIKFKVQAKTLEKAFEESARALREYIAKKQKIAAKAKKSITISAESNEQLLYSFIDELIFLLDAEDFLVAKAQVALTENTLKAVVWGDRASLYEGLSHVKAATYAEMQIHTVKAGYEIQAVLDV